MASSHSSIDRHNLRQKFDLIREECGDVCDTMIKPIKRWGKNHKNLEPHSSLILK